MSRSNFGSIQYVSKGKYRIWWIDGSGKRASKVLNGTRDDAELYLAMQRIGTVGCDPSITYSELWAAIVHPSFAKDGLATKTVEGYERVWERELMPRIGRELVASTTCERAEKVLRSIDSAWVQRSAYQLWKKICNIAIRNKIRQDNPIDRYIKLDKPPKSDKRILDASEVREWMESIRGIKYEPLLLAESGGGLRHEEATALCGEDIAPLEYRGKTYAAVSISKALVSTRGGRELKGTKNGFSEREMIIGDPFASRLLEFAHAVGPLCRNEVPHEIGDPWEAKHYSSPTSITNNYRTWCERNGIAYVNPGKLRKSWSIMQGEAGSPDSIVMLAMGHSGGDGTTRGRNYQKATRRGLIMIADLLAELIELES